MRNVILLHGHGGTPDKFWFPYAKNGLEKRGYNVWAPQLPDPLMPNLEKQLPYVVQHGVFTSETIIIAHSSGCPLTIALLEILKVRIRQVILVAAFIESTKQLKSLDLTPIIKEKYDWNSVRKNTDELIIINSNNDPFGCDINQAQTILDNTGGTLVVPYGEGHMGSEIYSQPYKEFPILLRLVV